jgi:hypothetical protein
VGGTFDGGAVAEMLRVVFAVAPALSVTVSCALNVPTVE